MTSDRLYPARPILAASVAVLRDGRILLAARGKPEHRTQKWTCTFGFHPMLYSLKSAS